MVREALWETEKAPRPARRHGGVWFESGERAQRNKEGQVAHQVEKLRAKKSASERQQ